MRAFIKVPKFNVGKTWQLVTQNSSHKFLGEAWGKYICYKTMQLLIRSDSTHLLIWVVLNLKN